jgi:hypothetical protein
VEAGATVLNVASQEGFSAGKEVVISGGGNSETRTIASVGSLVLTEPLTHGYPADATITGVPEESEHEVDEKAIATANCVLNILQATSFLARAGTIIAEAVHTCGEAEEAIKLSKLEGDHAGEAEKVAHETEEAINQLDTHAAEHPEEVHTARRLKSQVRVESGTVQQAQKKCAVNILHLISSFSYVASFLSFAVAQCPLAMGDDPESENLEAACAGSIINTITALSATAGSSIDMENSCDLVGQNITTLEENPTSRRLWGARSPKNKADAPFMV